jgi:hypothetical protein
MCTYPFICHAFFIRMRHGGRVFRDLAGSSQLSYPFSIF